MELYTIDPKIADIIQAEEARQSSELNLIASENYTPAIIRCITGSVLTNKYAEGYPGKRYYGGCRLVDEAEKVAIERACALFGAESANVQPHAGSQANMAAFSAVLKPGDTILGMNLAMGGHLTHGHPINFSGVWYNSVQYGVHPETEEIDYAQVEALAQTHKPRLIIVGASAYSRTIDFARFAEIAASVNAYLLADIAHIAGLVATKLHPSPFPHADMVTSTTHKTLRGPRSGFILSKAHLKEAIDKAIMPGLQGGPFMHVIAAKALTFKLAGEADFVDYQKQVIVNAQTMAQEFQRKGYRIVANGTDNHLFIIDLRNKKLNGKTAETILEQAGITISRSCIPFDTEKPWITSGIRIGTPAITTRNMKVDQALYLVDLIDDALQHGDNPARLAMVKNQILKLANEFPIPEYFNAVSHNKEYVAQL